MTAQIKQILWQQFGASIDMLENAIRACPVELWEQPSQQMAFWYLAYHTLWFIDFDLSDSDTVFTPPAFDIHNYEMTRREPPYELAYSKTDLEGYLARCRAKARDTIECLDEKDGRLNGCKRIDGPLAELLLYQMRHIQHHAAQLNLLLRQSTDSAPGWVRRAL